MALPLDTILEVGSFQPSKGLKVIHRNYSSSDRYIKSLGIPLQSESHFSSSWIRHHALESIEDMERALIEETDKADILDASLFFLFGRRLSFDFTEL